MSIANKIEAIIFFKNEPVSLKFLSDTLRLNKEDIVSAINKLQEEYKDRGIVVVSDGEFVSLGTHPSESPLIEQLQRDEYAHELGRAGLETLSIILYKAPVSRREIDYIRGVNSSYILRNLLVRGLVERKESKTERGYSYTPTLELLRHLGITRIEDLPSFEEAHKRLNTFLVTKEKTEE